MSAILPPSTIGILGGGQLGRMLSFVAKRNGYQVVVFSNAPDGPAAQVSDRCIVGSFEDRALLEQFAKECDVITYETENIPIETCRFLKESVPVRPNPDAIFHTQNRIRERELLNRLGIPVAPHKFITDSSSLEDAKSHSYPAILKTAAFGYDGKGQVKVASAEELSSAWSQLSEVECVLEERISFVKEFSIVVARGTNGESVTYGPIENHHENHILDISLYPNEIPEASGKAAIEHAKKIADEFSVEGVLTVEFFLNADGAVLVNEIAPRPHNSGHLTIEGFESSQFEQQLRGICGLPIGSAKLLSPVCMVNLLGDLWGSDGSLASAPVFSKAEANLHLYGKAEARQGRKMGHITARGETPEAAKATALSARESLSKK